MATEQSEKYVSGEEYETMRRSGLEPGKQKKVTVQMRTMVWVLAVVVLCSLSFAAGSSYQQHHAKTTASVISSNGFGPGGTGGRRLGAIGQVTAITSTSITVDNQRTGNSTTYSIDGTTAISNNGQSATASDVQAGDTVLISTASSTSTVATRIVINPSFGGFGPQSQGNATTQNN